MSMVKRETTLAFYGGVNEIGGIKLERLSQYALRFRSSIEVVVQYGRMDVSQDNLAYIGTMGHSE